MEYPIGVEMSAGYLSYEVSRAAYKLVKDVMLVQPGENVVITGDTSTDKRVTEALMSAAYTVGANPMLAYVPTNENAYAEPIAPLGNAVAAADVWIELSYASIMLCESWRKAIDFGCRYLNLTGMDVTMLVNCIGRVDVAKVVELGEALKAKLEAGNEIVIKDKNGTCLTARNEGRKVRHSGQLASFKGYPFMMCGQISWCPVEETINGKLVFDTAVFPPTDMGILSENIELTLEQGRVTKIEGGREAERFSAWLHAFHDPNMFRLAHYSLGFNPGVTKATGRIVEDERVFGCMEFGIGSQGKMIRGSYWTAASHTDGVVAKPTIMIDGTVIEADGKYVDPELVEICRQMGVAGYNAAP